jgi:hypothetical protein
MNIIPVQEQNDLYYLLTAKSEFPINLREFIYDFTSGGHGIYYVKPFLAKVQDGKIGKFTKLEYGGKIDETYYIKQVTQNDNVIHFLGFRQQEKRASGNTSDQFTPVILHHIAYDIKKNKVTEADSVYTDTPRWQEEKGIRYRYSYGDYAMDAIGDNSFVAFAWHKYIAQTNQLIKSDIFYWDYNQGKAGMPEIIADGYLPVVKADSLGNIHLLYVNDKANLMHKVKQKGIWQKENVLINKVDAKPGLNNIACVFDKNNNLHVIYVSNATLMLAKIKFD